MQAKLTDILEFGGTSVISGEVKNYAYNFFFAERKYFWNAIGGMMS